MQEETKQAEEQAEKKVSMHHDWYAGYVKEKFIFEKSPSDPQGGEWIDKLVFPFGGTLDEVKGYIDSHEINEVKAKLSWYPAEYVADYLYDVKNYPI